MLTQFWKTSNKRPRDETDAETNHDAHSSTHASSSKTTLPQPSILCAWNADSLLNRIDNNPDEIRAFLNERKPDILFVSEVRMPASGPPGCKRGDGKPRNRAAMARSSSTRDRNDADRIAAFLRASNLRAYYSLADYRYAGVALLVRCDCAQPTSLRYTLDDSEPVNSHHPQGRIIRAEFADFELLGTYTPNNGTTEESFAKRRAWDAACLRFLRSRNQARPLVWLGDLNVAAFSEDVGPDPEWFREKNGQAAEHRDDRGQPGFTINEQRRFKELMEAGSLVDGYRVRFPVADWNRDATWRGAAGVDNPKAGRYYGKGMRIDYILVSSTLRCRVGRVSCNGGQPGNSLRRGFLGSDHSPLLLELKEAESSPAPNKLEQC